MKFLYIVLTIVYFIIGVVITSAYTDEGEEPFILITFFWPIVLCAHGTVLFIGRLWSIGQWIKEGCEITSDKCIQSLFSRNE